MKKYIHIHKHTHICMHMHTHKRTYNEKHTSISLTQLYIRNRGPPGRQEAVPGDSWKLAKSPAGVADFLKATSPGAGGISSRRLMLADLVVGRCLNVWRKEPSGTCEGMLMTGSEGVENEPEDISGVFLRVPGMCQGCQRMFRISRRCSESLKDVKMVPR